jgi:hypothetical protein
MLNIHWEERADRDRVLPIYYVRTVSVWTSDYVSDVSVRDSVTAECRARRVPCVDRMVDRGPSL